MNSNSVLWLSHSHFITCTSSDLLSDFSLLFSLPWEKCVELYQLHLNRSAYDYQIRYSFFHRNEGKKSLTFFFVSVRYFVQVWKVYKSWYPLDGNEKPRHLFDNWFMIECSKDHSWNVSEFIDARFDQQISEWEGVHSLQIHPQQRIESTCISGWMWQSMHTIFAIIFTLFKTQEPLEIEVYCVMWETYFIGIFGEDNG